MYIVRRVTITKEVLHLHIIICYNNFLSTTILLETPITQPYYTYCSYPRTMFNRWDTTSSLTKGAEPKYSDTDSGFLV